MQSQTSLFAGSPSCGLACHASSSSLWWRWWLLGRSRQPPRHWPRQQLPQQKEGLLRRWWRRGPAPGSQPCPSRAGWSLGLLLPLGGTPAVVGRPVGAVVRASPTGYLGPSRRSQRPWCLYIGLHHLRAGPGLRQHGSHYCFPVQRRCLGPVWPHRRPQPNDTIGLPPLRPRYWHHHPHVLL